MGQVFLEEPCTLNSFRTCYFRMNIFSKLWWPLVLYFVEYVYSEIGLFSEWLYGFGFYGWNLIMVLEF